METSFWCFSAVFKHDYFYCQHCEVIEHNYMSRLWREFGSAYLLFARFAKILFCLLRKNKTTTNSQIFCISKKSSSLYCPLIKGFGVAWGLHYCSPTFNTFYNMQHYIRSGLRFSKAVSVVGQRCEDQQGCIFGESDKCYSHNSWLFSSKYSRHYYC